MTEQGSTKGEQAAGAERRVRGPNDPHRRERIICAAMRLIARSGIEGLTHRAIATEADVPLGSTTYYFKSLDDIIVAAIKQAIEDDTEKLARWADSIDTADDLVEALTRRIVDDSADRDREVSWYRLYLWGATANAANELSYDWTQVMTTVLERFVDPQTAEVLSTLYDSLLMRVLVSGGRVKEQDVARIIASVMHGHAKVR